MNSVAIIGAGITGLTAAFRLQREGVPVTVYEAADRVGGPIRTVCRDGYIAECGPNSILETSKLVSGLVSDLGLDSQRVYANPTAKRRYIIRDRQPVPMPTSPSTFLRTPLFSLGGKLRLAAEPFIACGDENDERLADFVRRRLGKEFLDYAINPFVGGIYAGDPEMLSVQQAFPKLRAVEERYGSLILGQFLGARERKRRGEVSKQHAPMFSFNNGLETLPQTLAMQLNEPVRLRHSVLGLRTTKEGWEAIVQGVAGIRQEQHSAALLALGAHQLARFRINDAPLLSPLSDVVYPPVASVTLGFRRLDVCAPLDGFGLLVPQAERMNILGTIFTSSLFPNRAPDRHVTLTSYIGGARSPHLALQTRDEIVQCVVKDVCQLLDIKAKPTFEHCCVFPEAIPQYNVGYGRFKQLMADVESATPGLFIAGHARCGISLADSIVSGHTSVERIENHLARINRNVAEWRLAHFQPS